MLVRQETDSEIREIRELQEASHYKRRTAALRAAAAMEAISIFMPEKSRTSVQRALFVHFYQENESVRRELETLRYDVKALAGEVRRLCDRRVA